MQRNSRAAGCPHPAWTMAPGISRLLGYDIVTARAEDVRDAQNQASSAAVIVFCEVAFGTYGVFTPSPFTLPWK